MRRVSRVVASSGRVGLHQRTRVASALFSSRRMYTTEVEEEEAPKSMTSLEVTKTGLKIHAYGIDYDMDFVSGLPPGSRELLEGTQPMPSTMAEIAGTFSDYPEIANQVYQIDSLLKEMKTTPHVSFTPTEAYLRDISVLSTLERLSHGMPPIEVALQHFWSAYAEVPKNNKLREANPTRLERVKAVLGYKYDPKCNIEAVREQKTAAIVQYLQAKSVAEKADAALALFSADESMKNQAEAFRTALQRARSDAEKETVVRQHLRWEEATEAAEELTQRHPEFTELKEVVSQFPPIVHFIGEPSTAHYKLKHITDQVFKKWLKNKSLSSLSDVTEKDSLLRKVRELIFTGKTGSTLDEKRVQELQRTFPKLLFSRDYEAFRTYLQNDSTLESQLDTLYELNEKEYPNDPDMALAKSASAKASLLSKHVDEFNQLCEEWSDRRVAQGYAMIEEQAGEVDKFVSGTIDGMLAEHPQWEKEIEDDIANHRWDPTVPGEEYEDAVKHYNEEHTRHA